jgi:predicted HAD superfamily Cof-like phosphohydrolase
MNLTSELTRQFHLVFGHPVASAPTLATRDLRLLRLKLLAEELCELAEALGFGMEVVLDDGISPVWHHCPPVPSSFAPSLPKAADALGDLDVVLAGTFLALGLPQNEIAKRIFASNMSKLGSDGRPIYREDGKILKGPRFAPPNFDDFGETPGV